MGVGAKVIDGAAVVGVPVGDCVDGSGVGFVEGAADGAGVMVGANEPP